MNKKGFTLIELLAVIVILAIIALIAVPIVLSIIDDTKESSILRSGEFFVDGLEKSIMKESMSTGNSLNFNECALVSEDKVKCDGKEIPIEINGELPSLGSVVNFKDGKVDRVILYYDNKIVIKNSDSEFFIGDINDISGTHISLLENQIKEVYGKDIKLGDYVEYDETKGGTITGIKDVEWRVLGIENGKILLMSATSIGDVSLVSNEDYVQAINNICKPYSDGEYAVKDSARSITTQDVNRITGYNPNRALKNGVYGSYHQGRITEYGMEVTYTLVKNDSGEYVVAYNSKNQNAITNLTNFTHIDGTKLGLEDNEITKKSITTKNSYYWYRAEVLTSLDPNDAADIEDYNKTPKVGVKKGTQVYDMLFLNSNKLDTTYWLAENYVFNVSGGVQYGAFCIDTYRVLGFHMWTSNLGQSGPRTRNVRAVVTLESDITLTNAGENKWSIQ